MRFTEKQFAEMLAKNPQIKIASQIGGNMTASTAEEKKLVQPEIKEEKKIVVTKVKVAKEKKIIIKKDTEEIVKPEKKRSSLNVTAIIKQNKESEVEISCGEDYFIIGFSGAKLLSINQIFALLQGGKRKYQLFSYKKAWHEIMKQKLEDLYFELKSKKQELPYFSDAVELTLFLQAPRLVDEDAAVVMFKYIIDALKFDKEENPHGILAEDNKKIIHNIVNYSLKGLPYVGLKIKRSTYKEIEYSKEDLFTV